MPEPQTTVEPWDNETCPKCGYAPETTCTDGADCPYNEGQRATSRTTLPTSLAEIVRAAVEAHDRTSRVFSEPAASQAAGESIRHLVETYCNEHR